MEKTTLYLPRELQLALREEARRSGRPQAAIVRSALEEHLRGRVQPRPRSIGIVSDGSLAARDVEAWLDEHWGGDR